MAKEWSPLSIAIPGIETGDVWTEWEMSINITIEDINGQHRVGNLELLSTMAPGIITARGDHSLIIVEILKKI